MNLAIFGTKSEAIYLAKQIERNAAITMKYFVDNNLSMWGRILDGKEIISFTQLENIYGKEIDAVIIAIRGTHSRLCVIQQLKEAGIKKLGILKFSVHDYQKELRIDDAGKSEYIVWLNELEGCVIPYLEVNVIDSCNLKCKGCTHFSNLFSEFERTDFQQFEQDLTQVAQKSCVIQLRLLGGEPLLNDELHRFVETSRRILPEADIEVVTNGLLIPKQEPRLFKVMQANNVGFLISQYKPTIQMKSIIEAVLQKNNVDYFFERDIIYEFGRTLSMQGNSNTDLSQEACISRGCRFLRNGYLYKCPFEGLADKFAITYGYELVLEEERGFDIYSPDINWEEKLNQYLISPVPMCRYCAEKCEMFEWEVTGTPDKEDWLVQ